MSSSSVVQSQYVVLLGSRIYCITVQSCDWLGLYVTQSNCRKLSREDPVDNKAVANIFLRS